MPQGAAETTWLDDSRKAAAAPEPFYGRDAAASTSATLLARLSGAVMTSVIRGRKSSDRGSSFRISVTVTPCTPMLASACFTESSLKVRTAPSIFIATKGSPRYGSRKMRANYARSEVVEGKGFDYVTNNRSRGFATPIVQN